MPLDLNIATKLMNKNDFSKLSEHLNYDMKRSMLRLINQPQKIIDRFFSIETHIKEFYNTDIEHYSALRAYIFRKYSLSRKGYNNEEETSKNTSTLLNQGYIEIMNILNDTEYKNLCRQIKMYIDRYDLDKLPWDSYLDSHSKEKENKAGTCFLDYRCELTEKISTLVTKTVKKELNINSGETCGRLTLARHSESDPSTLMHLDNMGILSVKWFYFPFECSFYDKGFTYGVNSCRNTKRKIELVDSYCPKTIGIDGVPKNYRISEKRHDGLMIKHFNTANTLVIADTSGLHCRYPGPKGSIRLTIQGGFSNIISVQ